MVPDMMYPLSHSSFKLGQELCWGCCVVSWLTDLLAGWAMVGWLAGWLFGWLAGLTGLAGWLACWLAGWMAGWLVGG